MKLIYKILIGVVVLIILIAFGAYVYLNAAYPKVSDPKQIKVSMAPEVVERGKYLANHVSVCIDCHSTRDWSYYSGPIKPGTEGMGGDVFTEENAGVPGTIYAKNITPSGIGDWTDGELYRTITTGVTRTGEPLFPLMPYLSYGSMDPEDVKAIIAYIRTLHPVKNVVGQTKINFPLNLIMRTVPHDAQPMKRPDKSDTVNYGKYMVTIAGCADCHTPAEKGQPIMEKRFAGGFEFTDARMGTVRSANLTPDKETGLGNWNEEMFVSKFKSFDSPEARQIKWQKGQLQSVMPWTMYAGMEESDLRAIYKYLRTLKPIKNSVVKFTAAK